MPQFSFIRRIFSFQIISEFLPSSDSSRWHKALLECGWQEDETATLWRKTRSKLGRSSVLIAVRQFHKFEIHIIQNFWEYLLTPSKTYLLHGYKGPKKSSIDIITKVNHLALIFNEKTFRRLHTNYSHFTFYWKDLALTNCYNWRISWDCMVEYF